MGTDIDMVDKKGNILRVLPFSGGSDSARSLNSFESVSEKAEICITYNYAWFYYKFLDKALGLKILHEKKGKEAEPLLKSFMDELMTPPCFGNGEHRGKESYWSPTPANVAYVVSILLSWCLQHPEGTFIVYTAINSQQSEEK